MSRMKQRPGEAVFENLFSALLRFSGSFLCEFSFPTTVLDREKSSNEERSSSKHPAAVGQTLQFVVTRFGIMFRLVKYAVNIQVVMQCFVTDVPRYKVIVPSAVLCARWIMSMFDCLAQSRSWSPQVRIGIRVALYGDSLLDKEEDDTLATSRYYLGSFKSIWKFLSFN